eukprot:tig00021111_g18383.t1
MFQADVHAEAPIVFIALLPFANDARQVALRVPGELSLHVRRAHQGAWELPRRTGSQIARRKSGNHDGARPRRWRTRPLPQRLAQSRTERRGAAEEGWR